MQLLECTYHIITGGAKGICPTHIHCSLVHIVKGSNEVPAFHLQPDPAETMPRPNLCYFSRKNTNVSRAHADCTAWRSADDPQVKDETRNFPAHTNVGEPRAKILVPRMIYRSKYKVGSPFGSQWKSPLAVLIEVQTSACFPFCLHLFCLSSVTRQYTCINTVERVLSQHAGTACHNHAAQQRSCSI